MNDILDLQYSLYHGLRGCSLFDNVNVVLEREMLEAGVVDYATIWQLPRNSKSGAGLLVEMPSLEVPDPNSLQRELVASVTCIEERNLNFISASGTGKAAEEWADLALDFMFNWLLAGSSGLKPEKRALERARDFVDVVAYRASVSVRRQHTPLTRVAPVVISSAALAVTLTCSTSGAAIYYTTDGRSFPGADNTGALPGEQAATLYTAPFNVTSGAVVRACAHKSALLPSHVAAAIIT